MAKVPVTFDVETAFLTRMRAAIVAEQPSLQGQTNAVINEAARVKARQLIREWVNSYEKNTAYKTAVVTAAASVVFPTDADIT